MKTIVISGISRGIGFELVKILQAGNYVIGLTSKLKKAETAFSTQNLKLIPTDLTNFNPEILSNQLPDTIDILINNAGILTNKPFDAFAQEEIQQILTVNFIGAAQLIQTLLPKLKQAPNAHVVNISSMGGIQGSQKFPGLSFYSASKGALAILTECLAAEYANTSVRFNCLALGAVQTEMLQQAFPEYKAPLSAKEMAEFIAQFALTGQNFFNGKILPVAITTP